MAWPSDVRSLEGLVYEAYAPSGEVAISLSSPRYSSGKARAIASAIAEVAAAELVQVRIAGSTANASFYSG